MPIKGLTDRGLSFPEIGQVRKGGKKEKNRPGPDLTYFRVEFDEREAKAAETFKTIYGEQPAHIRIVLPFNEIERMWDAWYEAYTAGRMIARSDGEFVTYMLDDQGDMVVHNGVNAQGVKVSHPEDGIAGRDYQGKPVKFKAEGRLKVILPELARAAYLTVITHSIHDIANISAQLGAFKELNHGQLAGIPFILRRKPKKISTPGENKQRVRRVKWLISIEADPEWVRAKLGEIKALATPDSDVLALPERIEQVEGMAEYDPDEDLEDVIDEPEWDGELMEEEAGEPPIPQNGESKAVAREASDPGCTPKFLVDQGIVKQLDHAKALMALLGISDGAPADQALERIKKYNAWRNVEGFNRSDKASREKAAETAIAGESVPA